jgi:chromate reductase
VPVSRLRSWWGASRSASITRRVARALIENAPSSLRCKLTEIGDLPLYNEDLEGRVPTWSRFRGEIIGSDAVLFVTPEYNRSLPGCLKNAIDVGSRPPDKSAWNGKAAGVVSATPHHLGGYGANLAVRQALVYLNMPVMQQPEAFISNAADLFGEDGSLKRSDRVLRHERFRRILDACVTQRLSFGWARCWNSCQESHGQYPMKRSRRPRPVVLPSMPTAGRPEAR